MFCTGLTKENITQTKDSLVLKIWRDGATLEDQDPSLNPNLAINNLRNKNSTN